MDVKDFLKQVRGQGFDNYFFSSPRRSYLLFETVVLKLLSKHLEDQNNPFSPNYRVGGRQLDGYAPEGFDNLTGPTLIEIKLFRSSILKFLRNVLDETLALAVTQNCRSVLLIVGSKLSTTERQRVKQYSKDWPSTLVLKVWNIDDVLDLLEKYAEFVSDLIPELSELAVRNVVRKSLDITAPDWRIGRDRHIEQLKGSYLKNDLSLFLGAGVSRSAGIPDWQSLISSLLVALIGEKLPTGLGTTDSEKTIIANHIQKLHGSSPLLETRYIRRGLGDTFGQTVSKYLYEGIGTTGTGTSQTLDSIAQMCIPPRSGPGIRALITYNFDDLMEKHLSNLGIKNRPIYKDGDVASQEELGIYHVHGFLPQNISQYDGLAESLLVFSEEGYHAVFLEPYSWSNLVQLNFLREGTCLLIGLSVTDPNLRRLLDIAARKNKTARHYVFLKRLTSSEIKNDATSSKIRPEVTQAFLSVHHQLQEASFSELGLNIIWLEKHDEIPEILTSIKT